MILALILMAVGGLTIAPMLSFMGTGLIAGQAFEDRMMTLYAADAGAEDALWKIKNDQIPVGSSYTLSVNNKDVVVDIAGVWILEGLEDPIYGQLPHSELVAVGRIVDLDTGLYEVEVIYDGAVGNVRVDRVGVWLPIGFQYAGSSSGMTTDDPIISDIRGGIALIWDFSPAILFKTNEVTSKSQLFYITPVGADPPGDFSWVRTTRNDIYLSWDGGNATYTVTATATDSSTGKQSTVVAHAFRDSTGEVGIIIWETNPPA